MTIEEGSKAPAFTGVDQNEEKVSLKELLDGDQGLILYFYPKDMTPGCTTQATDFTEQFDEFAERGYRIVGVSKDSAESHRKFIDKHQLAIDLIADESGKICEKYGAWGEKKNYGKTYQGIIRTTVVIDSSGRIEKVFKNVRASGHVGRLLKELN